MDRVLRNKKAIAFFVLPGLLAYTIFVFYPMIESVWFTFFEGTPHVKFEFVGLRNYAKLFTDKNFINSFKVTMQYLLVTGTGWILFGFFAALLLRYGTTKRFVNTARTIVNSWRGRRGALGENL